MTGGTIARLASAWLAVILSLGLSGAASAATGGDLFQSDAVISLTLAGPIDAVAGGSKKPREAVLVAPDGHRHPVRIAARGLTRLKRDVCQFAPIRIDFAQPPPPGSLFDGQRRLKLVTHCRSKGSFQNHLLLEYYAYRLYNLMSPQSFRVRLADIDYAGSDGRSIIRRYGFLIEDEGDVARRNGGRPAAVGSRVSVTQIDPLASARVAIFQYLIGNLDWSTRAGPAGERCCHNSRLIAASSGGAQTLIPLPYDFDYSGLVDAPYAVPPDGIKVRNVRDRQFRGFCAHNPQATLVAAEVAQRRSEMFAELDRLPGIDERARARARDFLDRGINDVLHPPTLSRLFRTCIG